MKVGAKAKLKYSVYPELIGTIVTITEETNDRIYFIFDKPPRRFSNFGGVNFYIPKNKAKKCLTKQYEQLTFIY